MTKLLMIAALAFSLSAVAQQTDTLPQEPGIRDGGSDTVLLEEHPKTVDLKNISKKDKKKKKSQKKPKESSDTQRD